MRAAVLVLLLVVPARADPVAPLPTGSPPSAVREALADVLKLPVEVQPFCRYISAYHVPDKGLPKVDAAIKFVVNSLSRNRILVPPTRVNPRLWRVILTDYHIPPKAWDDLGKIGSGPVPRPDPYFHQVSLAEVTTEKNQEYGHYVGSTWVTTEIRKEKVTTTKGTVAQGAGLVGAGIVQLVALTCTEFPVYRYDWFAYYALLEPRYHELLGLGDKLADFDKLALADDAQADKDGEQVAGNVVQSEVTEYPRYLERTPSTRRKGRGYRYSSFDFLQERNLLERVINKDADAQELIAALPNGLQFYYIVNDKKVRLDEAVIEVARDKRTPLSSPVVRIRNCITCHAGGLIPVDDEVRAAARGRLALVVRAASKDDAKHQQRIIDKFFDLNFNDLVVLDSANYAAAVKAVNGLTAAGNALALQEILLAYEQPLTLVGLAAEVGYPVEFARGAIERAPGNLLDPSVVGLANDRPRLAIRGAIERAGFQQLLNLLSLPRP